MRTFLSAFRCLSSMFKLLAMVAMLFTFQARATEPVICFDAAYAPFASGVAGQAIGLYPAIFAEASQVAQLKFQQQPKPWKRCIAELDAGKSGVGGIYKTSERLAKYDFSAPVFVERLLVVFHKSNRVDFIGHTSLFGKRVGVLRGWSYGDEFDKAVKEGKILADEVDSDSQNFQRLAARRIDAMITTREVIDPAVRSGKLSDIEVAPIPLQENEGFLAFSKTANQKDALNKINLAIESMRKSGRLTKIAEVELNR